MSNKYQELNKKARIKPENQISYVSTCYYKLTENNSENNETISGSWDVISLWKIEKDNDNWKVVKIVEHA